MQLLAPATQAYAWGSRTLIQQLRGDAADSRPIAELWYGAHPSGPSVIDGERTLADVIAQDPATQLGHRVVTEHGNRLPFLLKLLAADQPLSLQAHPSKQQAEEGFSRENNLGIALGASNRNYKDDNHKPELLVALTEFHAMAGFRPLDKTRELFQALQCEELNRYVGMLDSSPEHEGENLRALFTTWITIPVASRQQLIAAIIEAIDGLSTTSPEWIQVAARNVAQLNDRYPNDIGVLGALLLNYVVLQPGEAIYLSAGNLHAYVKGLGVEIMANSDNVLRGGLTPKYVDVPELVRVLRFESLEDPIVRSVDGRYEVPINEFALQCLHIDSETEHDARLEHDGPMIAVCTSGELTINDVVLAPTQALWISADDPAVEVTGSGELFVASV